MDHMYGKLDGLITWLPEVVYRHLAFLSSDATDPLVLFESLGLEFQQIGVSLVDEESYRTYLDPLISSSRISFDQEKGRFLDAVSQDVSLRAEDFEKKFVNMPDEAKPLFVSQMAWKTTQALEARLTAVQEKASRDIQQLSEQHVKQRAAQEALFARQQAEQKAAFEKQQATERAEWERKERERRKQEEGRKRNLSDPRKMRQRARFRKKQEKKKR